MVHLAGTETVNTTTAHRAKVFVSATRKCSKATGHEEPSVEEPLQNGPPNRAGDVDARCMTQPVGGRLTCVNTISCTRALHALKIAKIRLHVRSVYISR